MNFVSELEFTYISLIVNIRSILHKSIQFMLEFLKGPVLVLHFSCCINDLLDDVICDIAIYADETTLYSKCDQAFDLW